MTHFTGFLGDLSVCFGVFNRAMCFLASCNTFGWNTCAASSSLVISVGCFLIFRGMVML